MRTAFIRRLEELARDDERVQLVVGDLGYSVVEPFAEALPQQYVNAAIAEQHMAGMAAGMALAGNVVFTYSIANFPTLRCLEQLRNDVCYHRLSVKVVSVGGGMAYGSQGYSHFAVEELAIMRALPNITVAAPADPAEARAVVELAIATDGPWYIRLGKAGEPDLHDPAAPPTLTVGEALTIRDPAEARGTVLATGGVTVEAQRAVDALAAEGQPWRLLSCPFVQPLDEAAVREAAERGPVVTVEEHRRRGGFGSAVAEVMAELGTGARLTRLALPEQLEVLGSQAWLRGHYGLDAAGLRASLEALGG